MDGKGGCALQRIPKHLLPESLTRTALACVPHLPPSFRNPSHAVRPSPRPFRTKRRIVVAPPSGYTLGGSKNNTPLSQKSLTMPANEPKPTGEIVLYQTADGNTRVECRFADENIWLTQRLLSELYQIGVNTINHHIKEILADGELTAEATIRQYRIVQTEGARTIGRQVEHYHLEMILAVGYRVRSPRGTAFRQWATARLLSGQSVILSVSVPPVACAVPSAFRRRFRTPCSHAALSACSLRYRCSSGSVSRSPAGRAAVCSSGRPGRPSSGDAAHPRAVYGVITPNRSAIIAPPARGGDLSPSRRCSVRCH